jgi:hypothetical protein
MYIAPTSLSNVQLPYAFYWLFSVISSPPKLSLPSPSLLSTHSLQPNLVEEQFVHLIYQTLFKGNLPWDLTSLSLLRPFIDLLKGESFEKSNKNFEKEQVGQKFQRKRTQIESLIIQIKITVQSFDVYDVIFSEEDQVDVDLTGDGSRIRKITEKKSLFSQVPLKDKDIKPDIKKSDINTEPQHRYYAKKKPVEKISLIDLFECVKRLLFFYALKLEASMVTLDDAWECYTIGNFINV